MPAPRPPPDREPQEDQREGGRDENLVGSDFDKLAPDSDIEVAGDRERGGGRQQRGNRVVQRSAELREEPRPPRDLAPEPMDQAKVLGGTADDVHGQDRDRDEQPVVVLQEKEQGEREAEPRGGAARAVLRPDDEGVECGQRQAGPEALHHHVGGVGAVRGTDEHARRGEQPGEGPGPGGRPLGEEVREDHGEEPARRTRDRGRDGVASRRECGRRDEQSVERRPDPTAGIEVLREAVRVAPLHVSRQLQAVAVVGVTVVARAHPALAVMAAVQVEKLEGRGKRDGDDRAQRQELAKAWGGHGESDIREPADGATRESIADRRGVSKSNPPTRLRLYTFATSTV